MATLPDPSALSRLGARVRSLWRGLWRRADFEAEMAEEFRHHLALRTEDLVRRGLSPREAARRAHLEFGHVEAHKERARASRGLGVFDQVGLSWLDVKLGVRMLTKYPGLSLVSVVGMSVAIAIGAGGFGLIHALVDEELPLDEGDRVVTLQNAHLGGVDGADRNPLDDLLLWREQLESVRELSAFVTDQEALAVEGGGLAVVPVARMTASGFRLARVAPVLGRALLEEDEREGTTPVVVIAHEEWHGRFAGDPDILGRPVRLGTTVHTVVGVMPEGFGFPINHRYWVPLRADPTAYEVGGGPAITMFGRLADGATLERAQAELTTIGTRMSDEYADTDEHLRPRVLPYTDAFVGIDSPATAWLVRTIQFVLSLLLVVVSVNVAVLVYARTAARMGEIAVRTALGASRRRVVTQLFAEALVLSLVAALVGLGITGLGFRWFGARVDRGYDLELPYWVDLGLSPPLIAYVAGLAVLAAAIVGVLPGLEATGRAIQRGLQQLHSGGPGLRLGRTWTVLIVFQVAIAVAVLPYALYVTGPSISRGMAEPDYPVDEFLRALLSIEGAPASPTAPTRDADAVAARFLDSSTELLRRIEAEPAVSGVTFARRFPGSEEVGAIEVEAATRTSAWLNQVDIDLFTVFDVPVLAGRGFTGSDVAPGANAVVVDRVFAERVLGGGDVLARRVRLLAGGQDGASGELEAGPWLEIVGVVPAFTVPPAFQPQAPKLYQPLALTDAAPGAVHLAIRARRDAPPVVFLGRLREVTASVDPTLQLAGLATATDAERERRELLLFLAVVTVAVTSSVLLLSAAGIYAMMSFTVASRRREIGIRSALGAAPGRVLSGIFKRAGAQLGAGALGGLLLAEAVVRAAGESFLDDETALLLPTVAVLMMAIGLLAALGPARRGLAVQPTEALREE